MNVPAASSSTVPTLVTLDAVRAAAGRIAGVARVTPVLPVSSDESWAHLLVKCENLQVSGSFKVRGAYNFVSLLDRDTRARGVVTYSSGNHGQALALAARRLGVPAVVVMPTTAAGIKIEGAKALGAEVHFAGTTTLHRKAAAEALAQQRGLVMVPPFDHEHIIEGQGTVGLEIAEQAPDVTAVYVPAGGGGLIAGIAAALRRLHPAVRIVGAEPEGAPKMPRSLAAGAPVTLERIDSIADGLLAVRPGDITFAHVRALVDEIVTVTDDELRGAMRFLATSGKLVAEPSGAAAVAAARRLAPPGASGRHVAVISGGNVEPARLGEVLR